jgi:hypothetical protein
MNANIVIAGFVGLVAGTSIAAWELLKWLVRLAL